MRTILACLGGSLAEAAVEKLLASDRVARNLEKLQEVIRAECDFLSMSDRLTYDRQAGLVAESGYTVADLKLDAKHGCHPKRAFMEASWTNEKNVHGLWLEVTSLEMWRTFPRCFQKTSTGFSRAGAREATHSPLVRLAAAGRLLLGVEWSTNAVEQGHSSCVAIHRWRPHMEGTMLIIKAFLHLMRALFRAILGQSAVSSLARCQEVHGART